MTLFDAHARSSRPAGDAEAGCCSATLRARSGYRVQPAVGGRLAPLTVISTAAGAVVAVGLRQTIPSSGYRYLTTRDGTAAVDLATAADISTRYRAASTPADPASSPDPDRVAGIRLRRSGRPQSGIAIIANLMGFAVVDVNMRGTGCSGGAFVFFEPLQRLDGYDVIETNRAAALVLHRKVGMMGISYGGYQPAVHGREHPPSLAALARCWSVHPEPPPMTLVPPHASAFRPAARRAARAPSRLGASRWTCGQGVVAFRGRPTAGPSICRPAQRAGCSGREQLADTWPYEMPIIPTLRCSTQGCRAIVSITS